jgi:hypothetical protein
MDKEEVVEKIKRKIDNVPDDLAHVFRAYSRLLLVTRPEIQHRGKIGPKANYPPCVVEEYLEVRRLLAGGWKLTQLSQYMQSMDLPLTTLEKLKLIPRSPPSDSGIVVRSPYGPLEMKEEVDYDALLKALKIRTRKGMTKIYVETDQRLGLWFISKKITRRTKKHRIGEMEKEGTDFELYDSKLVDFLKQCEEKIVADQNLNLKKIAIDHKITVDAIKVARNVVTKTTIEFFIIDKRQTGAGILLDTLRED